jgi:alpha-mannosidase
MPKRQVYVIPSYHCDVVWRRSPEEQVSIRQQQYDAALRALREFPEFRFEFDQATLVREYLENNPARLEEMRGYVAEGRLDVTGGEEAIPDTNLVMGESLVRNIFLGRLWFEETLGVKPVVGNMEDAFGLSVQLPQIFAGFGCPYFRDGRTVGLDNDLAVRGVIWEGPDGSRVRYATGAVNITEGTHVCNLPVVYSRQERPRASLLETMRVKLPVVLCRYGSEEDLVEERIVRLVLDFPRPPRVEMRFALAKEALEALFAANPKPAVVRGEFNPSQPGTHITRISLKQAYRTAEWGTITAEAAAACAALGGAKYPRERLAAMWRKLAYVSFHDSLCGCHVDSVNRQVMGYCRQVRRQAERVGRRALGALAPGAGAAAGVVAFNPLPYERREPLALSLPAGVTLAGAEGKPLPAERRGQETLVLADLAPLGTTQWRTVKASTAKPKVTAARQAAGRPCEVGSYRVTPRDDGLTLHHTGWNRTLADGPFPEVRFRREDGTMWDERILGPMFTEADGDRELVRREEGPVSVRLLWRGLLEGDPSADPEPPGWKNTRNGRQVIFADLRRLAWEKEVIFYHDLERIDVTVRLDFAAQNTEVMLGFPLQLDLARTKAVYEVPFAAVERRPYYEVPAYSPELKGAPLHLAALGGKGAWPALTWVAYGDRDWSMLCANQGTPSHRLMSGMIEIGVLRSPTPISSGFHSPPGSRENGQHEFRFALLPFRGDAVRSGAYHLGAACNAPPLLAATSVDPAAPASHSFLTIEAPGVAFSCFKQAERQAGYVLRSFETGGRTARGRLQTAFPIAAAWETDLMEQPVREVNPARLQWRPWEIKTLLLET